VKGKVIQMVDASKAVKALKTARAQDLKTRAVRLSSRHKHLSTTKTKAQRDLQNAERINRNAPVKTIRADGSAVTTLADGSRFDHQEQLWNE
tara:strand:+ start:104 stop:379 length:276 start_codon:yes stop_codon:yes gene_type:complete